MHLNVSCSYVFDELVLIFELSDRPQGNAAAVVEGAIFDPYVCAVGLLRYVVVSAIHSPPCKGDIVGVDGVSTIGVQWPKLVATFQISRVDVDVLEQNVIAVDQRHGPHSDQLVSECDSKLWIPLTGFAQSAYSR